MTVDSKSSVSSDNDSTPDPSELAQPNAQYMYTCTPAQAIEILRRKLLVEEMEELEPTDSSDEVPVQPPLTLAAQLHYYVQSKKEVEAALLAEKVEAATPDTSLFGPADMTVGIIRLWLNARLDYCHGKTLATLCVAFMQYMASLDAGPLLGTDVIRHEPEYIEAEIRGHLLYHKFDVWRGHWYAPMEDKS